MVAEFIHYQYESNHEERLDTHQSMLLMNMVKDIVTDLSLNGDDTGPGVFLVKQIARQYGVAFLTNVASNQTLEWIVPPHLRQSNEVTLNYTCTIQLVHVPIIRR